MAGVIKREQTASVSAFSLQDFEGYARKLVRDAKEEAARLRAASRAAAEAEAEQIRQTARIQGLAEGRAEGMEQIRAEAAERVLKETGQQAAQAVAALTGALQAFEQNKQRLLAQAERGVLDLAIAIARRVCKVVPTLSVDAAVANVRQALLTAGRAGDLEVSVSPAEHAAIERWAGEFLESCETLEHVTVVADEGVSPGGCRVRGKHVAIDASLDTQLARVTGALCGTDAAAEDGS